MMDAKATLQLIDEMIEKVSNLDSDDKDRTGSVTGHDIVDLLSILNDTRKTQITRIEGMNQ